MTGGGVVSLASGIGASYEDREAPELIQRNAARGCYTVALLFWPLRWLCDCERRALERILAIALAGHRLPRRRRWAFRVDTPILVVALGGASTVVFFAVHRFGRPGPYGCCWRLTILYFRALAPIDRRCDRFASARICTLKGA